MATSGGFVTNQISRTRFYFNWQQTGQDIGANKTNINWQAGITNNIGGGADLFYSNAVKIYGVYINGSGNLGSGTWSNITSGGTFQLLSGNIDIYHNTDGTKNFGANMTAWTFSASNYSGSGSWDLTQIPRMATITSTTGNINDETTTVSVTYSNPGGFAVDSYLELPSLGGGAFAPRNPYSSGANMSLTTGERNAIRAQMASVNSTTLRYVIHSVIGGLDYWAYQDYTISIINANPTFNTITTKDSNSTTTTITGNDQYLIQGNSVLEVGIASGDKALPLKSATMVKYNSAISSYSIDTSYTTSTIAQTIGAISNSTNQLLTVRAIDSRGNYTDVTKTINILPYSAPTIIATGVRQNNFEATTTLHVEGVISLLTISGSNKNAVNTSTGVAYRYKESTAGSFGSWVNLTSSTNSTTGAITVTDFTLSLDNTKAYDFEFRIVDKLNTSTAAFQVSVGIPIFRVGTDGFIYNNEVKVLPMIDEDSFASNLDTRVPTQQSVKAYVDKRSIAFLATRNTSQNTTANADLSIIFNNEVYDYGSCYDTSTGLFTAPYNGVYHFTQNTFNEIGTITRAFLYSRGTANSGVGIRAVDWTVGSGGNQSRLNADYELYMSAGQTFGVGIWTSAVINLNSTDTRFSGHIVMPT